MARKAMVTRRFTMTRCVCKVYDPSTETVRSTSTVIPGAAEGEKLEKKLKASLEGVKLIDIISAEKVNKLMGMYEDDFIAYALTLDEKTRQPASTKADNAKENEEE